MLSNRRPPALFLLLLCATRASRCASRALLFATQASLFLVSLLLASVQLCAQLGEAPFCLQLLLHDGQALLCALREAFSVGRTLRHLSRCTLLGGTPLGLQQRLSLADLPVPTVDRFQPFRALPGGQCMEQVLGATESQVLLFLQCFGTHMR